MSSYAVNWPAWGELPDFGLYMDQLVTFTTRILDDSEGLGQLTPGMINSYVKSGLMERPNGKKYGRTALAQLLMIRFLKPTLSLDELKMLLHTPSESTETLYERFRAGQTACAKAIESLELSALDAALQAAQLRLRCLQGLRAAAEDV